MSIIFSSLIFLIFHDIFIFVFQKHLTFLLKIAIIYKSLLWFIFIFCKDIIIVILLNIMIIACNYIINSRQAGVLELADRQD